MAEYLNTQEFGAHIDRVNRVMKLDLVRRFKRVGVDLTPEQWVVLSKAADKDELSQTELANASFKDAPTVSRIIDLLCKKGYMSRSAVNGDRRKFNISLTESGNEVVKLALPEVLEARKQGWNGLSKIDFENFIKVMDTVMDNYQSDER